MSNDLAFRLRLSDVIAEYEQKIEHLDQAIENFNAAGQELRAAATVKNTYGRVTIDTGNNYKTNLERSLLKSAWQHIYDGLQIERIASAEDKRRFNQAMENPVPFTMDNIRATFGDFIMNPRQNILRGLAEVFCTLDQAYKSHDKVKIGVQGLPKRVILSNVGGYSSYGRDRLENILNALALYQEKPVVSYQEINDILKTENALKDQRGVWLKRYANGNGHLYFDTKTLKDINKALAEYYGDVLADCSDDKPNEKNQSTAVSKDLQYYPTPQKVVDRVVRDLYNPKGKKILEPSCGCGRFLDALCKEGAEVFGIEVDVYRVRECQAKGHNVLAANFLETVPTGDFDQVVMNPPFYGKHYAKHVEHALKYLKDGGRLTAILPITARYDHGLIEKLPYSRINWEDLPVGSFSESGTNVNTTVLKIIK